MRCCGHPPPTAHRGHRHQSGVEPHPWVRLPAYSYAPAQLRALEVSGGNKSKAAALLRIKRSTLGDRINRCGLGRVESEAVAAELMSDAAVQN